MKHGSHVRWLYMFLQPLSLRPEEAVAARIHEQAA